MALGLLRGHRLGVELLADCFPAREVSHGRLGDRESTQIHVAFGFVSAMAAQAVFLEERLDGAFELGLDLPCGGRLGRFLVGRPEASRDERQESQTYED